MGGPLWFLQSSWREREGRGENTERSKENEIFKSVEMEKRRETPKNWQWVFDIWYIYRLDLYIFHPHSTFSLEIVVPVYCDIGEEGGGEGEGRGKRGRTENRAWRGTASCGEIMMTSEMSPNPKVLFLLHRPFSLSSLSLSHHHHHCRLPQHICIRLISK